MRKGAKARPWTVAELASLRESAGKVPRREICGKLRRSRRAVESQVMLMRSAGEDVTLRCFKSRLSTCPACGALRSRLGAEGICEPCRRRRQLEGVHAAMAGLLARLPPEERAVYAETEAETGSRADPMPRPPDTAGMGSYERARAEEAHEVAVEDWLARNLRREIKAAQKRKERVKKKLKTLEMNS